MANKKMWKNLMATRRGKMEFTGDIATEAADAAHLFPII